MDGVAGDVHAKEPRGGVEGVHGVEDEVAEAVEDGPTSDPLRRLRGLRMVTHEAVGPGGDEAAGASAPPTPTPAAPPRSSTPGAQHNAHRHAD